VPLDDESRGKHAHSIPNALFKAVSERDGEVYALRRFDGPQPQANLLQRARSWCSLHHPNVVQLHDIFTEPGGGGAPLTYFVERSMLPSEENLWSHALQLLSALHAIHLAGAAVRLIDTSHVLLTDKHTVRLSSVGLIDVARPDPHKAVNMLQVDDLQALGQLLLCVACASPSAASSPSAISRSMEFVTASFSPELQHLLLLLLSDPKGAPPTVHDAVAIVSGRMMTRMAQTQAYADALSAELAKEMENGRLLRLLAKLNAVKDRATLGDDMEWGEHDDRYMMRLLSDSLFGQIDEEGKPVLNLAQLIHSLNKLDVGHEGRALLTGRHDGALLLVSYKDLKAVLDRSFGELTAAGSGAGGS